MVRAQVEELKVAALEKFAAEQGVVPFGEMWEEYLTEPSGDPSTWQTRVVLLLE